MQSQGHVMVDGDSQITNFVIDFFLRERYSRRSTSMFPQSVVTLSEILEDLEDKPEKNMKATALLDALFICSAPFEIQNP